MSALVVCPDCGKRYKVGDNLAGQRVRCGCGRTLTVPTSDPPQASGPASGAEPEDQLDESLYDVIAAKPADASPISRQAPADDLPDDLLDETIWDTGPEAEEASDTSAAEVNAEAPLVAELAPAPPGVADNRPRPAESDADKHKPDTFWDRIKAPSRELIAWLAIGHGTFMTLVLLALIVPPALILAQASAIWLMIFLSLNLVWIAVAVSTIVGGVLIRKRHPLGPPCAGLASAATSFSWLLGLLMARHPIEIFLVYFAVEFVLIYSIPLYIIYWCLKEEDALDEEADRDEFYAIRDSITERMIEENQREWSSK